MIRSLLSVLVLVLVLVLLLFNESNGQSSAPVPPTSNGYNCSTDRSIYPCQAYAFYRASPDPGPYPPLLDLPSIADLFSLPRRTIALSSNLTSNTSTLSPSQPLLIPLTCACISTSNISAQLITYQINAGDTYYTVSSYKFANLTSYPAVINSNPGVEPTTLSVGQTIAFPVFCQCPAKNSTDKLLITYTFQPNDTYSALAAEFGTDVQSLTSLNGPENRVTPFLTILIPVAKVPPPVILNYKKSSSPPQTPPQPPPSPLPAQTSDNNNDGVVTGLAVGLGVMGLLWVVLVLGLVWLLRRRGYFGKSGRKWGGDEEKLGKVAEKRKYERSASDEKLMTDISEWLDKYKVYRVDELEEATDGFDSSTLIQGSVYRGVMDGEVFAIKKMKWNACDELKILQKV